MANTDEAVEVTKKQVAKHYLLNAQGEVVDDEKLATGIRYVQLSTKDTFDYQISQAAMLMLACFGAKTLATNESSQVRNNPKGSGSDAEQMEAVRARFQLLDQGEWVDRTREPGAAIDKDAMAEATIQVLLADGKITEDQVGDMKAKIRQKLEDSPEFVRTCRMNPKITAAYGQIKGRAIKTSDDILAAVS